MMDLGNINSVYFIGIGGIGMSALARYFLDHNKEVCGYDRTSTSITKDFEENGVYVHYDDTVESIPVNFRAEYDESKLVIYTPAISDDHNGLTYLRNKGYKIEKRARILGEISKDKFTIAVAGTHGKTSTACFISHLLKYSDVDHYALIGGISTNYNTNYISPKNKDADLIVLEADEYDRSFLNISPDVTIVTSTDKDHLDIYNNQDNLLESYQEFVNRTKDGGTLIRYERATVENPTQIKFSYKYGTGENCDINAENIKITDSEYCYDLRGPDFLLENIKLIVPGEHNVLNSVAAISAVRDLVSTENLINGSGSFKGVKRRFEYIIKTEEMVFIDDYAHHPSELEVTIKTVKDLYPDQNVTGIFQPHLYTRTRDFATEFGKVLSNLDNIILLDIYPAREKPIKDVTSKIILDNIAGNNKFLVKDDEMLAILEKSTDRVFVTLGAGNIDLFIEKIKNVLIGKVRNV